MRYYLELQLVLFPIYPAIPLSPSSNNQLDALTTIGIIFTNHLMGLWKQWWHFGSAIPEDKKYTCLRPPTLHKKDRFSCIFMHHAWSKWIISLNNVLHLSQHQSEHKILVYAFTATIKIKLQSSNKTDWSLLHRDAYHCGRDGAP